VDVAVLWEKHYNGPANLNDTRPTSPPAERDRANAI